MKTIKATTQRGAAFIHSYNRATATSLEQVYSKCSSDKYCAYYECRRKMQDEDGEGFYIMSYNTYVFTCGWQTAEGLRVETSGGSYLIK